MPPLCGLVCGYDGYSSNDFRASQRAPDRLDGGPPVNRITVSTRRYMAPSDALNAYDRRELMPMRPCLRLTKLRYPATEATLDVSDAAIATVPELPSAPRIHPELPRARPAARSALLRWPLPAGQATIVPCPSPHDRHPRYRRACR